MIVTVQSSGNARIRYCTAVRTLEIQTTHFLCLGSYHESNSPKLTPQLLHLAIASKPSRAKHEEKMPTQEETSKSKESC